MIGGFQCARWNRGVDLCKAAGVGDVDEVRRLLARGADPNAPGRTLLTGGDWEVGHNSPPLTAAVSHGRLGTVHLLLEHGADPNRINAYGETPLHEAFYAHSRWQAEILDLLLAHGGDPNVKNERGWTPLYIGAKNYYNAPNTVGRMITVLLRHGADINARDPSGHTPLDMMRPLGDGIRFMKQRGAVSGTGPRGEREPE